MNSMMNSWLELGTETDMFKALDRWFEPVIMVATLAAIIVLVFADVIARFAFDTSISIANELARFSFVYMIYFGVSYAIRQRRHMRVTYFLDKFPRPTRKWIFALAETIFLVYSIAICNLGVNITTAAVAQGKILSSTGWPLASLYIIVVISGFLSSVRLIQSLYRIFKNDDIHIGGEQEV